MNNKLTIRSSIKEVHTQAVRQNQHTFAKTVAIRAMAAQISEMCHPDEIEHNAHAILELNESISHLIEEVRNEQNQLAEIISIWGDKC
ncbi:hypothetical protein K6Y31_20560 [Motilimonas cestriensis]|uniref:Phage protein n=1 Tax=Motilimonas cestriensis TaxID=2742685 RepID=A0ABS8WII9_9GAMM|nr:hypothetical protein [Motilimonas cestriensis]MCE2597170.1 hypothetical protein [Motilimonas cestriensis]